MRSYGYERAGKKDQGQKSNCPHSAAVLPGCESDTSRFLGDQQVYSTISLGYEAVKLPRESQSIITRHVLLMRARERLTRSI